MSWFSSDKKAQAPWKEDRTNGLSEAEREAERRAARQERVDALAREAQKELLAKADAVRADTIKEHEFDSRHYEFEARRWGDFLHLNIKRWGYEYNGDLRMVRKGIQAFSTTINLMETCDFTLYAGEEPGHIGLIRYTIYHGSERGEYAAPEASLERPTRRMFARSSDHGYDSYASSLSSWPPPIKPTPETLYPQYAKDDRIIFERIGVTLYAPYGLGVVVQEKILEAIEEGSGWRKNPS